LHLRTDFAADTFAPFGSIIASPAQVGERQFYSEWLGAARPDCLPVFHTNLIKAVTLPTVISRLEKHPHAAQCFVPLDVCRYLVVVAPSDPAGNLVPSKIEAFLVPSHLGVIYRAGTWHAGASVLDRDASFTVLMWRGATDDDVFAAIDPVSLAEPQGMMQGVLS
jgi:ureidoglycolate lyase